MKYRTLCLATALCGGLTSITAMPNAAMAQGTPSPSIAIEATTDYRERGISWSDGKPAVSLLTTLPITYDLAIDADATTLRDSPRHDGADVALTIAPRYTLQSRGWDFTAGVRGNVFLGASGTSYAEVTGEISRTIGPAQILVGAAFAPSQKAIGGKNLYLDARTFISVPGTPFTLYGGIGHTSGSTRNDDAAKTARLRPGGDYLDHHVGIEYVKSKFAIGARYSGTSIGASEVDAQSRYYDRDYGSRVIGYVRFTP